jgi:hypothetical protein
MRASGAVRGLRRPWADRAAAWLPGGRAVWPPASPRHRRHRACPDSRSPERWPASLRSVAGSRARSTNPGAGRLGRAPARRRAESGSPPKPGPGSATAMLPRGRRDWPAAGCLLHSGRRHGRSPRFGGCHLFPWVPEADEQLQAIITATNASSDLIGIAREIDFWLARDPLDFGDSRFDTVRLGVVRPLAVLFDVLDAPPPWWQTDPRRLGG